MLHWNNQSPFRSESEEFCQECASSPAACEEVLLLFSKLLVSADLLKVIMVVCCEPGAQVPESAGSVVAPSSYTRWYCEENIYQFLARLLSEQRVDAGRLWAVFLSNTCAQVLVK